MGTGVSAVVGHEQGETMPVCRMRCWCRMIQAEMDVLRIVFRECHPDYGDEGKMGQPDSLFGNSSLGGTHEP